LSTYFVLYGITWNWDYLVWKRETKFFDDYN